MAYQDHIKIRAYTLYINGTSFEETAKTLSKDFKISITANTIKNWSEKKDARGFSWEDYRSEIRTIARQTVETAEKNRLVSIRDKTETLVESLYDRMTGDAAPKLGSFDGGSYAFRSLSEFLLKLDEKTQAGMSEIAIIQMVLDIFSGVPDVAKAINKHWKHIEKEIRIRILQESPENIESQKMIEG
jgi:hypothetical protein